MIRDILGKPIKVGQFILPKNIEALPFIVVDISTVTQLTPQGPMDVTRIKMVADITLGVVGNGAPANCYVLKEPEEEKKQLIV